MCVAYIWRKEVYSEREGRFREGGVDSGGSHTVVEKGEGVYPGMEG